jgi:hypothetical protein
MDVQIMLCPLDSSFMMRVKKKKNVNPDNLKAYFTGLVGGVIMIVPDVFRKEIRQ